jgi:hypothetical protein
MENCASLVEKYMVENGLESLLSGDKVLNERMNMKVMGNLLSTY